MNAVPSSWEKLTIKSLREALLLTLPGIFLLGAGLAFWIEGSVGREILCVMTGTLLLGVGTLRQMIHNRRIKLAKLGLSD